MLSCNFRHPSRNEPGASQLKRASNALGPGGIEIDARKLADFLYYIYEYSGQVNFYRYFKGEEEGEYTLLADWRAFFIRSIPFLLARISRYGLDEITAGYSEWKERFNAQPTAKNLELLQDYCFESCILPIYNWYHLVLQNERNLREYSGISAIETGRPFGFKQRLADLISSELSDTVAKFIQTSNYSSSQFGIAKPNFFSFTKQSIWNLKLTDIVKVSKPPGSGGSLQPVEELMELAEITAQYFNQCAGVIKRIKEFAAEYIPESLLPLEAAFQKYHEPHLGLLFTFLELFKYLQGDLNKLSEKHLDFFYRQVLRIQPRPHKPDQAHLVFEVAKQLDKYLIRKDTIFKDGKDGNKEDVLFKLDDEIVIDKAKVDSLRTLYLNQGKAIDKDKQEITTIEGVYMAPVANSADGKGKAFPDNVIPNWFTLGAKESKSNVPGKLIPAPHPDARIGFILASPVLFLQEGKREIVINICCDWKGGENRTEDFSGFLPELKNALKRPEYVLTESKLEILADSLNDAQKAYFNHLLSHQNPYNFGYDIKQCLAIKDEPSCAPLFSDAEINKIKTHLEKDDDGFCLLIEEDYDILKPKAKKILHSNFPRLFPSGNRTERLPVLLETKVLENLLTEGEIGEKEFDEIRGKLLCNQIFNISLTGENGWYNPKRVKTKLITDDSDFGLIFEITLTLDEEEPPIICYDEKSHKPEYKLEKPLPLAKVELNSGLKLLFQGQGPEKDCCCLEKDLTTIEPVSLYHFFRSLNIKDTNISVRVCGIKKNIIIQNEEGLLDPNSPFHPFGVRPVIIDSDKKGENGAITSIVSSEKDGCPDPPPKPDINLAGPCFYLGSNEILNKCWKEVCIHLNWKGKPGKLAEYYEAYDSSLNESDFEVNISVLEQGQWKGEKMDSQPIEKVCCPDKDFEDNPSKPYSIHQNLKTLHFNRELFEISGDGCACVCPKDLPPYPSPFPYEQTIKIESRYFELDKGIEKDVCQSLKPYQADTKDSFIQFCLENQDFFHSKYAITLAKQMTAMSTAIPDAVFKVNSEFADLLGIGEGSYAFEEILSAIKIYINDSIYTKYFNRLKEILAPFISNLSVFDFPDYVIKLGNIWGIEIKIKKDIDDILDELGIEDMIAKSEVEGDYNILKNDIQKNYNDLLKSIIKLLEDVNKAFENINVVIPNEPWTPTIKNLSIDYSACATKEDINLIHLYPFDGTYKNEDLEVRPYLFPFFDDEGTLFIGLKDLRPGANLHLLFQLAEATADSELDRAKVNWHYLSNNRWQPLREGFEIIADDTNGLTVSGVVKISVPGGISRSGNTIMPSSLYWIKASVSNSDEKVDGSSGDTLRRPGKVKAICNTIAVHTQAAKVTFSPTGANDLNRLSAALPQGSLVQMLEPEAGVKKIGQPYASFGGRLPEAGSLFYQRVSEQLRHKGRAIGSFDYEAMVLDAFPQIFKVKCINHDFGLSARDYRMDLELAPGFIVLAVIPDLTKLQPGQGMEPKAPVSLLEEIKAFLKKKVSPFARLKVLNPRYEKVDVEVTVKLRQGRNMAYYSSKLKEDLTNFLAPWYITKDSDKLAFGQPVNYSEIVKFIERLDYIDFIACLYLFEDASLQPCGNDGQSDSREEPKDIIEPLTARSILTAGEICVKVLDNYCDAYCGGKESQVNCEDRFHPICREENDEKKAGQEGESNRNVLS